jgi:hypothetical protein
MILKRATFFPRGADRCQRKRLGGKTVRHLIWSDGYLLTKRSWPEWSRRESSDMDEARKGERAGASESIEAQTHARS